MSPLSKTIVALKAELKSGKLICKGSIESISKNNIYFLSGPTDSSAMFPPGADLELKIFPYSDNPIQIDGIIKWSYRTPPHGYTNSIGIELKNPPVEYKNISDTLHYFYKTTTKLNNKKEN